MGASSGPVEVYSDGGISPAVMIGPTVSRVADAPVGRILVLIPAFDFGYIEQVREGFTTKKGNLSSNLLEIMAIRRAREIGLAKNLSEFVILTDIQSFRAIPEVPEARRLEEGKLQLAGLFLQRIMDRARYLRGSARKKITRPPPDPVQIEIFNLFKAEKKEFRLHESPLWRRISVQIASAKGEGQGRLDA